MQTISELSSRAASAFGSRVAVVDGTRSLTFREVGERSRRLANVLFGHVRTPDARVAILMRNRLEYIETDFAIAHAGLVKVPINPRLSDDERRYILEDAAAEVLVTETSELERVRAIVDQLSAPPKVIVVDAEADAGEYETLLRSARPVLPGAQLESDRLSLILYTSGTTGRPKGAMLTDGCRVAATTMMLAEEYQAGPDDGMIHAGPLSHGSGSKVLAYFARGARNIVLPKFEPAEFFRAITHSKGTSSFVVPTMIKLLIDACNGSPPPSGLKNLSYGGASISRELLNEALSVFGPILTQVYGACEAPHPVIVLRHRDQPDASATGDSMVPAGRAVMGVSIRVEERESLGRRTGELAVRGPNVMKGYWGAPREPACPTDDGWYRTGDIARIEDDGLVYIVDREKDMIISGGLNVYPAEVERVLGGHPDVDEVAVVGIADEQWGEIVAAAVVPRRAGVLNEEMLSNWCAEYLAGYKKPRIIRIVDGLPKGSTGKIRKADIRDMIARSSPFPR